MQSCDQFKGREYLKISEVAFLLNSSRRFVEKLMSNGIFSKVKMSRKAVRIPRKEVMEWLRRNTRKA